MRKQDIEVGQEYAFVLAGNPDLTRGIRGYAGKLARGRVVEKDAEFEVDVWHGTTKTTGVRRGYRLELVEPFVLHASRWEPGETYSTETGRDIVCLWETYASELAVAVAEAAERTAAFEAAERRFETLRAVIADAVGLPADEIERLPQTRHYGRVTATGLSLTLDQAERVVERLARTPAEQVAIQTTREHLLAQGVGS